MNKSRIDAKGKVHYSFGQWLLTILTLVFVFTLLNIFSGFAVFGGALFGINYFTNVRGKKEKKKPINAADVFRGAVYGLFFVAAVLAPTRVIFLGVLKFIGKTTMELQLPGAELDSYLNPGLGICGALFGIIFGLRTWNLGLRMRTQIENIPTSTAHGAAIGIAEFKGRARSLDEASGPDDSIARSGTSPDADIAKKLILQERIDPGSKGETVVETKYSPFLLEDETGRILVDPEGVQFWDGYGNFFWSPVRSIYLQKRFSVSDGNIHTRTLLSGDEIYLIGRVEENPKAAGNATDENRLVIRPSREKKPSGVMQSLLWGDSTSDISDIHHIFFLTDLVEVKAAEVLTRGLKRIWIWILIWVILSLLLIMM
jgi:hypothetical protein